MESKKVLLPTIIAVATLLVAVVGATFAYFNVVSGTTGGTATVTATSPTVGTVSLTGASAELSAQLTAAEITNPEGGTFTLKDAEGNSTVEFGKIEASEVTGYDVTYACTFDVVVTKTGFAGVTGGNLNLAKTGTIAITGLGDTTSFDAVTAGTYNGTVTIQSGASATLTASANIVSSTDAGEAWLSGIDGSITLTAQNLACSATASSAK